MNPRPLPIPVVLASLVALALAPDRSHAAWPHQTGANLLLATSVNEEFDPRIVSDGAGGAIITWYDYGGPSANIYAQHVTASGTVDPTWPAAGLAVCSATGDQFLPVITSDGAGGAIVAWMDFRPGSSTDIYAQRVLASGVVDPAWPVDGRAICVASANQVFPTIVPDGAGGAILAWRDGRNLNDDIFAQRVLASGVVDPAWPLNGRALCVEGNPQGNPVGVQDGAGGAIVVWTDFRPGVSSDVYAQRVLATGVVDLNWTVNGVPICTAAYDQSEVSVVADGVGGAIVAWYDARDSFSYDIYAHRVMPAGFVDPSWPVDGQVLCASPFNEYDPDIASDGNGGAIVAWDDSRGDGADIYAQHVLASGAVDSGWPANGRAVSVATNFQENPSVAADGAGGVFVAWMDTRGGAYDIYASRVRASGVLDPAWPVDGRAVSTAASPQEYPFIVADGAGGILAAWQDYRTGDYQVYAQRVGAFGYLGTPEPVISSVRDVPNDQGGRVKLSWDASWLDYELSPSVVETYRVYRSAAPNLTHLVRDPVASRIPFAEGAGWDAYLTQLESTSGYAWEYLATVNAENLPFITSYSYIASTLSDSTGDYNPTTAFLVAAFDQTGGLYWASRPDSGYSADNLPPATPAPFIGNYVSGVTHLHWNANPETDLSHYRLYRGSSAGFVPGPSNLIGSPPDTGFADPGDAGSYYKLSAVDQHGNESGFALLSPGSTTDVASGMPAALSLSPPSPNPAIGEALLAYALPRSMDASLAIYDLSGRRIRSLASGPAPAGEHSVRWDLRSDAGRALANGVYFVGLEADGRTLTRRLSIAR